MMTIEEMQNNFTRVLFRNTRICIIGQNTRIVNQNWCDDLVIHRRQNIYEPLALIMMVLKFGSCLYSVTYTVFRIACICHSPDETNIIPKSPSFVFNLSPLSISR
jgi:hypothetical protein